MSFFQEVVNLLTPIVNGHKTVLGRDGDKADQKADREYFVAAMDPILDALNEEIENEPNAGPPVVARAPVADVPPEQVAADPEPVAEEEAIAADSE